LKNRKNPTHIQRAVKNKVPAMVAAKVKIK
jgi:hypothetical protein